MSEIYTDSIYNHPVLYDVLFSVSCSAEMNFLLEMLNKHCRSIIETKKRKNRPVSFLEPACGTGRLLWRLKKLGFDAAGLDLNPHAVDYCNKRLRRHGFASAAVIGDMADFSLATFSRRKSLPFDLAFNFVSSFLHLTEEKDAVSHLHHVADCLTKDGLYILGIHLLPKGRSHCHEEHWHVRHGNLTLQSVLKRKSLDEKKRLETVEFKINAYTPKIKYAVCDTFPLRTYSLPQIMRQFTDVNRFEILETFDFNLDCNVLSDETEDVVFVLKKRQ
ncbi:MAG: class I SAM-dependent methyltransferase [Planctomycetaceae bacterium]|nr:class I SAM-dependent methyltransferase [Planctomycetaceae bacterium]